MRRLRAIAWFFMLILALPSNAQAADPNISARSAILMDVTTGEILFAKDMHSRMEPASTTKVLTAVVALEKGSLLQLIRVSENASQTEGSSIWLEAGEVEPLGDLLHGLLLSSGNDAAVTIAENLAGSEEQFVAWMNEKARQLGAVDSQFANTSGLPDSRHYTSVYDMALITRYALGNPTFSKIVGTRRHVMPWPGREWDRALTNHNKLLWRYEGADGVKTGYTRSAGHCLVATATRGGQRLLAVVFKSGDIYGDSAALFDWGFSRFALKWFAKRGDPVREVPVQGGVEPLARVVPAGDLPLVLDDSRLKHAQVELSLPEKLQAPLLKFQRIGALRVRVGDEVVGQVDLVTRDEVPRRTLLHALVQWIRNLLGVA